MAPRVHLQEFAKYPHNSNIQVAKSPTLYRDQVFLLLDQIRITHAGGTVMKTLGRAHHTVHVIPNTIGPGADSTSIEDRAKVPAAYRSGAPVMERRSTPGKPDSMIATKLLGTGMGTDALIKYDPTYWRDLSRIMNGASPGDLPDEVLFHELFHAMRVVTGTVLNTPVPEDPQMDNLEEFCSVVVTNIYRSERKRKGLRKNHGDSTPLSTKLSDPSEFYRFYKKSIDGWIRAQRKFCIELASGPATFNPLAAAADDLEIEIPVIPVPMTLPE